MKTFRNILYNSIRSQNHALEKERAKTSESGKAFSQKGAG